MTRTSKKKGSKSEVAKQLGLDTNRLKDTGGLLKSRASKPVTSPQRGVVKPKFSPKKEMVVKGTTTGRVSSDKSNLEEVQRGWKGPIVRHGAGPAPHGIVRARAGTGKTFTLVLGVANIYRKKVVHYSTGPAPLWAPLWGKVEKALGFKVQASPQQQSVWDFMSQEHPRSVCYVAFNSSIVEEFSEKYAWLVAALKLVGVDLTFSTIHSLGNSACREAYKLKGWKTVNQYRVSDLLSAYWEVDLREVWKEKAETIDAIKELVGLCKLTLAGPDDGKYVKYDPRAIVTGDQHLDDLATHYGVLLNGNREEVFEAVRHILNQCRTVEEGGRIDFNDMIWLPVVNNLPVQRFDLLLVDEAQDLNRCQQELVLKAGKRIILVGDERQAIYGFAGADTDSIDRMQALLKDHNPANVEKGGLVPQIRGLETLFLTQTRRCGKAIVEKARTLVPDFEAHASCPEGKISQVRMEELEGDVPLDPSVPYNPETVGAYSLGESDFVLCRVNAPLVGLAFRMLKAGKRVNIKGRDIGTGLKQFIKKSKQNDVGEFLVWLDLFQEKESERIKKRRNVDTEALVTLEDKCLCLRTLCEGAFTLKDVYKNIDKVFQGKVCPNCEKSYDEHVKVCYDCREGNKSVPLVKPAGTLLSSIHRAKGLEAKRVFILRPDLMPHPKAKSEWEKGQEANLQYVAWTRAINELVFVEGKEADSE